MRWPPLRERLLSRVIIDPDSTCALWTGYIDTKGYGVIGAGGKNRYVHRVMWEMFNGPIPEGLQLDHLCRVHHCASLAHLEPVTQRENIMRGQGAAAKCAAKTHCNYGHPFDQANTYIDSDSFRRCRICFLAGKRAARQRRRDRKDADR